MTDEEIIQRLKDLWINNISNVNSSSPTYSEGSGTDEETTSS
jgi:hypothetical protein